MTDKTWIERLQEIANAHPHELLDLVGSPEMIAAVTTGRVSVFDALDAWQRGHIGDDRAMQLSGAVDVGELYVMAYASEVEIRFARPVVVSIPGVMSGDPVIAGTRVLAGTIYAEFLAGADEASIREGYPSLPEGVLAAVLEWQQNT